ncbi:uncharacterized protein LOC111372729 [Olea europaea var. sylvestris]|uniref:Uncharacterized protein n=1 Tax=Olea europaea subsp. europaea TaxID=158383 RepID=A0A8S0UH31_OLEEU|nr:uncharacterized protein LOC111372729 [Olea europaea var. sylvestris]XP_022850888.1 uncharacterized protein LOC111372729 [Olea europaea var. sylvestris]CAA3016735.1 Hypothetical predicted protein [Olea europaea subsp. europaea]
MPSNAKKRKAAKRKKGVESSSNNNSNSIPQGSTAESHGDDDLKHQDDKESDGGEVSSPASQEHCSHQHYFTENEEVEVEQEHKTSNVLSVEGTNNEAFREQKSMVGDKSIVLIERDLNGEDESDRKDIKIVYDGGEAGSSNNCSSDDESHVVEDGKIVVESVTFVDSAKLDNFLFGRQAEEIDVVSVEEDSDLVEETCPFIDSEKISILDEKVQLRTSAIFELKANEMEKLSYVGEKVIISATIVDVVSERNEDVPTDRLIEIAAATSNAKECGIQENDDKLTPSYTAPKVDPSKEVEREKDNKFPEVLAAPGPTHPVQTTSWKSCCGLFEALTGSGR